VSRRRREPSHTPVATQTLVPDDVIAVCPAEASRRRWFHDHVAKYGAHSCDAADATQAIENTQFDELTGFDQVTAENHSGWHRSR
jgi:hypothetical protein